MDPIPNKERPSKRNNSSDTCHSNETVARDTVIRLDEVVEADRRRLHESESNHAGPELQADPPLGRGILSYKAEDERAACCDEEGWESGDKAGLGLGKTVAIFGCHALSGPICDEVGVDLSEHVRQANGEQTKVL